MNHLQHRLSPIKICLQDSIFRHKNNQLPLSQLPQQKKQPHSNNSIDPISSFSISLIEQPVVKTIDYLNAQYYGFAQQNKPNGPGIIIDDEMNFFLSSWNNLLQMNKLSFVKIFNQTIIYGTWINGRMHGWNSLKIGKLQIFIEVKYYDNLGKGQSIFNIGLVIDRTNNICYLLQIQQNQKTNNFSPSRTRSNHFRLKIINRKEIPLALRKQSQHNISLLTYELFPETNIKIPQYLSSLEIFLNYFSSNNPDILFREIFSQNQRNFFLSIQNSNDKQNSTQLKFKPFSPYRELLRENKHDFKEVSYKQKQNMLGILMKQKANKTKSIGTFNSSYQLNGIGMTQMHKNTKLFGRFKCNLLTREYNQSHLHQNPSHSFNNQTIKKKLTHHHQKSTNFHQDIIYFEPINQTVNLAKQINQFVTKFQTQYIKRYSKAIDSFSPSEQSFEAKYYEMEDQETLLQQNKWSKKQHNQQNAQQVRPFGKIINSRSPLRNLKKSHSKSPSDIETFRQRRPLQSHYIDSFSNNNYIEKSQPKNPKNLTIHTHSAFNSQFNQQQTSKNRSYTNNSIISSINYKEIIETKMKQQAEKEDIVETVRRRNQFSQSRSHQRRNQLNSGYKCRYDRLEKPRQTFWK